ncbi:MAG: hypothetical protein HYT76_05030 [Deltaproteobacteria bacterium]|nr:hypothetical protein [Deltaproteobacteria bacterium]
MGDSYTKILKGNPRENHPDNFLPPTYDLNHDGVGDLLTAQCHKEGDKEVCKDYQVRLGLRKGGYVDLYGTNADPEPIKPGDTVYYSAKFYAENPYAAASPGQPIPYPVKLLGPQKAKLLSKKELQNRCNEELKNPDQTPQRLDCIRQAETGPEDHTFQPHSYPEQLVYFEPPKKATDSEKADLPNPAGPIPPDYLVKEGAIRQDIFAKPKDFDFLDFGTELAGNIIARVKDGTSTNLGDYLFALEKKAITEEELVKAIATHWADLNTLFVKPTHQLDDREKKSVEKVTDIVLKVTKKSAELKDGLFTMLVQWDKPRYRTYEALSLAYKMNPEKAEPLFRSYLKSSQIDEETKEICREILGEKDNSILTTDALIAQIRKIIVSDHPLVMIPKEPKERAKVGKRLKTDANRLIATLAKRELTPEQFIAVLDLIHDNKTLSKDELKPLSEILNGRLQNPNFLIPFVNYLLAVTKPDNWCDTRWQHRLEKVLPNLTRLLGNVTDPEKIPEIEKLLVLADRIVAARGAVLVASAHKIPSLKQPLASETATKLKKLFGEQARSLSPGSLLSVAYSARQIIGQEAVPLLIRLSQYFPPRSEKSDAYRDDYDLVKTLEPVVVFEGEGTERVVKEVRYRTYDKKISRKAVPPKADRLKKKIGEPEVDVSAISEELERLKNRDKEAIAVRLAAYQALTPFLSEADDEVKKRFHAALDDDSAAVRVCAAQAMIEKGDPYVVKQLVDRLTAYLQDPLYLSGRRKDLKSMTNDEYYFFNRYKMEVPVTITSAQGRQAVAVALTLKTVTLLAMSRFADDLEEPREKANFLAGLIAREDQKGDLVVAIEALASLVGPFSLSVIKARIDKIKMDKKPIPPEVSLLTIAIYQKGIEALPKLPPEAREPSERIIVAHYPMIFDFLADKNPDVHRQALITLRATTNDLATLESLLSELHSPYELAQQEATRALKTYEKIAGDKYAGELREVMAKTQNPKVRAEAATRLEALGTPIPTQ